jgi:two-component system sensor histidine kinase KdpD
VVGTLRELIPANADQAPILATARAEAERLQRFIANLLDMVRIEAGAIPCGPRRWIWPKPWPARCTTAPHSRPVTMDIAPDLPLVMVDPRLFHHCLINLIENAVRHGGEEGAITLAHSAARKDST